MGQRVHVLAIPYPSQGHVNPMLQFSRRLVSKGLKATLAITTYISNTMRPQSSTVQIDTISDGYDEGGFYQADSIQSYLSALEAAGSKSLAELIKKYEALGQPFDCIIYDAFIPWALDVAGQSNLAGAAFFTQACVVDYIYYLVHHGKLKVPMEPSTLPLSLQGLPLLQLEDMPSFIYVAGSYPAYFELLLKQFVNVVDTMCRVCPLLTIGPTVPSAYLDNRVGIRVKVDEKGIARREEIERYIREVTKGREEKRRRRMLRSGVIWLKK
ncbi:hypothetical protein RJ641_021772 [Dillenia turbinata]|uniref:Glycosyltransferase N-terminal domain-containing protein n=1 Tax=Dillenia turbinata TaxID=194707 RepID=A0AAN8UMD2_9MAGN